MVEDEFRGRVALVTGAAGQGIGRAIASRLSAGGADTVVTDVHPGHVERVAERGVGTMGGPRHRQGARRERLRVVDGHANAVAAELGPIQIFVHNRGLQRHGLDLHLPARGLDPGHGHQPERTVVPDQGRDVADGGRGRRCHRRCVGRRLQRPTTAATVLPVALRREQSGAQHPGPLVCARGWSPTASAPTS